jgi:hypothetical protein
MTPASVGFFLVKDSIHALEILQRKRLKYHADPRFFTSAQENG